jgi:hypothetical protein
VSDERGERRLVPPAGVGDERILFGNRREDGIRVELTFATDLVQRPPPAATEIEAMPVEDASRGRMRHGDLGKRGGGRRHVLHSCGEEEQV